MSFFQLRSKHTPLQRAFYPTVTTQAASSVTDTTATGNGTVVNEGGSPVTARGVVWSTSINPTLADSSAAAGAGGAGAFTASITGLSGSTNYFVRAYATNAVGTAYGDNVTFTTNAGGGGGSLIKTINGKAIASVKTVNGLAIASVKTKNGLTNV